jgi:hypothetical protein
MFALKIPSEISMENMEDPNDTTQWVAPGQFTV